MQRTTRRDLLIDIGRTAGVLLVAPSAVSCIGPCAPERPATTATMPAAAAPTAAPAADGAAADNVPPSHVTPGDLPKTRPAEWNAVAFNRERGNAGFIPPSYLGDINGPDGEAKHLGKHLPYVPKLAAGAYPPGYLPLAWGDPAKGHAKHPNAAKSEKSPGGHWYDWVRVRKAADGDAVELQSEFDDWPTLGKADSGKYTALSGLDIAAEDGRNTVYLVKLPDDVNPGDTVRIYAHCRTHGRYVDFVVVPPRT